MKLSLLVIILLPQLWRAHVLVRKQTSIGLELLLWNQDQFVEGKRKYYDALVHRWIIIKKFALDRFQCTYLKRNGEIKIVTSQNTFHIWACNNSIPNVLTRMFNNDSGFGCLYLILVIGCINGVDSDILSCICWYMSCDLFLLVLT